MLRKCITILLLVLVSTLSAQAALMQIIARAIYPYSEFLTKGGTKKRDVVNKRLGKLDKQYGAIRLSYNVTLGNRST